MKRQDEALAQRVSEALAGLDARFASSAAAHPFAGELARGSAAIDELLAIAEAPDQSDERRCDALAALGLLLQRHGVTDGTAARLAGLGGAASASAAVQSAASRALMLSGYEPFLAAFEVRLASPDPRLAAAAAQAMGVARRTSAVPALVELFAKTPDVMVRAAAAQALGDIGDPRASEVLEAAFKNALALVPVIEALGKLGGPELAALLAVALRDASDDVRLAAAAALARLLERHPGHDFAGLVVHLRAALERETEPLAGVMLIAALVRVGEQPRREQLERVLGVELGGPVVKGYLGLLLNKTFT